MKAAVSSRGKDIDSEVDPRFGRAANFIIVDTDSLEFNAIDNAQIMNIAQGAGIQAAQAITNAGAEVLITGHCGPKAFRVLGEGGIKVVTGASGTVREAVEEYKKGNLTEADRPDVQGHW